VHFLKEKLYSPVFSADYGESLGVYLIAKATKHIDHCGGLTDLLVMRNGEIPSLWIEEKETSERLARMEKIENSAFNQIRKEFEKDFVL
jgi:hypothetical protein